jgi:hypothetical protein
MSTVRAFEDTGSTAKAFAGEEVDWYVCNIGSFHIQQSMDRSVPVTENKDVARYLMANDTVLFQQAALAVGEEELVALSAHFAGKSQWAEAAKSRWAVYFVSSSPSVAMMDEVMELLEKCGPTRTSAALQLELDVIGSTKYQWKYTPGSAGRAQVGARIAELSQNPLLRTNPWSLVSSGIYPKVMMLLGVIPPAWAGGKKVEGGSVVKGMSMWRNQAMPLMQSACDNAVGARKVILIVQFMHVDNTCSAHIYADAKLTLQCFVFLKEWLTITKLLFSSAVQFLAVVHITEESVALFQAVTDEHWGVDCSMVMEAISFYKFDRHFQIARGTALRFDYIMSYVTEWYVTEKTGNIQHCIEINDRKYRAVESYMRAAPPPGRELLCSVGGGTFAGVEAHHQHLQPRHNIRGILQYAGIDNIQQVEEGYRSSAETGLVRSIASSSADGLAHMMHEHAMIAVLSALLSFAMGTCDVELSWLDDLPPADATTLHCTSTVSLAPTTARVLVAEVFEQQGRHADAIRFAQADLQDYHNLNVPSKVRAGRVLGRCHAARGQHMLSVSAFDAAIGLARSGKLLLAEALAVRGRAAADRNGAGGSGLHWDEETGKQRLAEVMGRMQGPKEALERVLVLVLSQ